jgi:2-polyprenyl-3-methyl-5-hydroxy-6-metoxy-1,4-benzoquinol methylase/predicted O-methyltransferase YrrM
MAQTDEQAVRDALRRVRELTAKQLPTLNLPDRTINPDALPRFSKTLRDEVADEMREGWLARAQELEPWLQGPFHLGGGVVIEGLWRNDERWAVLDAHVPDLEGKRVVDIGSNAGYDPFMFHLRGAADVLACEPFEFIAQAHFLESIYETGVRFEQIGWQQLDPAVHGTFDVIHCNGVLYHEPDPLGMLARFRAMLADDGLLLLGTMMLASSELSEYARFVPGDYAGDPTWWWVPGRLATRWMMEATGFLAEPIDELLFEGPAGAFGVVNGYLRGRPGTPDSQLGVGEALEHVKASEDAGMPIKFPLGHYYSPLYDARELAAQRERIWTYPPRETPGLDWRDAEQVRLCRNVFASQQRLVLEDEPTDDPSVYYAINDQYPPLDAWVLEGLLRHLAPKRMIEIGSGFSTLISASVNRDHLDGSMHLTCIEPYPREFLIAGVPGVSELRVEKVQDTPLDVFAELGDGDALFVDTSHTVKTGGDVTWIFQEIVPRLAPGVFVHVHDIFLPGDYPEPWVMEGWGWNEMYLVRAFLTFNDQFEIVWGAQYMLQRHPDDVLAAFPEQSRHAHRGGGSLWLRRR